jgi:hypothetical protein
MTKDIERFLIKLLIFVMPIIIVMGFVELRLRNIPNSYNLKRIYFEDQLESIQILVLGSSEALHAINPGFFEVKGFNLSNVSQSFYYDSEITLRYIDKMKNLKSVIITVFYSSFWYQLQDTKEGWRDYFYFHYWDIKYPGLKWYDSRMYSFVMLYTPRRTLEYAEKLFRIDLSEGLDRNGWAPIDAIKNNPNISDIMSKERVKLHESIQSESKYQENLRIIDNFVCELRKRHIKVFFVIPPVPSTYSKYTNPKIREMNEQAILELCRKYNGRFFNYFTDKRFATEEFSDNDHLNSVGAEKFSKILNDDIISNGGY